MDKGKFDVIFKAIDTLNNAFDQSVVNKRRSPIFFDFFYEVQYIISIKYNKRIIN